MKNILTTAITATLAFSCLAYAIPPADVTEGAIQYDWQTCVDIKTNLCMNTNCITSTDTDCKENCIETAQDKCQTQGIFPPP